MLEADIVRIALDAGFMIHTNYGQDAKKLMPVSDIHTLKKFIDFYELERKESVR